MSLGANSRRPRPWPGCSVLVQGRSATAGQAELGHPHAAPPHLHGPGPAARSPGPPLMPAMAVTSLLAPRPGRWPGDPRRAAAARQHPEVHAAALPPAARAGAWGRARPVWGRPPSFAAAGRAGTCGAGPWFPSGPGGSTGLKSPGSPEEELVISAGSLHVLHSEFISPPTTQSVTREMGALCFSPWVPTQIHIP